MMSFSAIAAGMELPLSIRGSNIAFTIGAKVPLLEKAERHEGKIFIF